MTALAAELPLHELLARVGVRQGGGGLERSGPNVTAASGTETTIPDRRSRKAGPNTEAWCPDTLTVPTESGVCNIAITLPEQEGTEAFRRRDALDAAAGAPLTVYMADTDEVEAERERWEQHQAKRRELGLTELQVLDEETGEVWEMPPLTPERQAKLDRSRQLVPDKHRKTPTEKLAEATIEAPVEREVLRIDTEGRKVYAPTFECKTEGCTELEKNTRGPDAGYCEQHTAQRRQQRWKPRKGVVTHGRFEGDV